MEYTMRFLLLLSIVASAVTVSSKVQCRRSFGFYLDEECKSLYRCIGYYPVKMPDCGPGLIYSRSYHVCVYRGSEWDDCSPNGNFNTYVEDPCANNPCQNGGTCKAEDDGKSYTCQCPPDVEGPICERPLTIEERCTKDPSLVVPHPTECQLYYDCSTQYENVVYYEEKHLRECPYPELFSEKAKTCLNFTEVECGNRMEHKSACNYRRYQCRVAHCVPCMVNYPSCEGKDDGLWAHGYKTNSPHYMICYRERFVSAGMCKDDPVFNMTSLAYGRECKSIYEIPKEQNGLRPTCEGKMDGSYPDEQGHCDRYFSCRSGAPTMNLCPPGAGFDVESASCMPGVIQC